MAPLSALRSSTTTLSSSIHSLLKVRSPAAPSHVAVKGPKDPNYVPGAGSFDPKNINNKGVFALFALIGAAFVIAAIWFFFWAKNGGFHFRKGDWEEYKSTVLRRKGPNGTTLSGDTKTTRLGGGSIVAEGALDKDINEEKGWRKVVQKGGNKIGKKPRGNKDNDDEDVRAYRHEKPARVGGLNRDTDGVVHGHDFASSMPYSDTYSQPETGYQVPVNNTPRTQRHSAAAAGGMRDTSSPTTPTPHRNRHSRQRSGLYGTPASNRSTDSHRPLRPNAAYPGSSDSTPTRSRNSSPRKAGTIPGSFDADPLDVESRYSYSDAGVSEDSRGTRSYYHPIPGLGGEQRDRRSGLGGRTAGAAGGGFRRGRGRRDSLSDSEGETVLS